MISRSIATLDGQRISIDIRAMAGTESEFEEAELRMDGLREAGHAVSARYDRRSARVVVMLTTGVQLAFPARLVEGLAGATAESLGEIEISPSGGGLGCIGRCLMLMCIFPRCCRGVFGSGSGMARELGANGGSARPARVAAARENGRKGGRPRKRAAD